MKKNLFCEAPSDLGGFGFDDFGLEEPGEEGGTEGGEPDEGEPQETEENAEEESEGGEVEKPFDPEALRQQISAEEQRKAQERIDQNIAQQYGGQVNPYTGKPINSEAELQAYHKGFAEEQQRSQLEKLGVAPEVLQKLIAENPAVKQAQEYTRKMEAQQVEQFANTQMQDLVKQYPDCGISSLAELEAMENGGKVLDLWGKGIDLPSAYAVANMEKIMGKKTEAAKQAVRNQITGKGHLQKTESGGAGSDMIVPADVKAEYRAFKPNMTDEEITREYTKFLKG